YEGKAAGYTSDEYRVQAEKASKACCGSERRTSRTTVPNSRTPLGYPYSLTPGDLGASPQAQTPRAGSIGSQPARARLDELFSGRRPDELRLVPGVLPSRSRLVETERRARAYCR